MIGYPLDSHVEYDTDGTPIYDRAISSAPMRKLYKKLFSDGVLPNPSTNMQVSAGTGMNVIVSPGFAMCNGCMKLEEAQRTLAVQASSAAYDRIDTVVLRLNDNDSERICDFYILQGTPAVSPVRPELTRTESIWELGLADLFIAKNSTAVSNQRITDTRYETSRCGIISSISEFDTTTLYNQVQADLAGFKENEQADFIEWFEYIKGQLSEDVAGNLQNQIGTLPSLVTEIKTSLVDAINWVVDKLSTLASKIGTSDISEVGDGTVTGAIAAQNEALAKINTNLDNKTTWKKFNTGFGSSKTIGNITNVEIPEHNEMVIVFAVAGRSDAAKELYAPSKNTFNSAITINLFSEDGIVAQFCTATVKCTSNTISCTVVTDKNLASVTYISNIFYR